MNSALRISLKGQRIVQVIEKDKRVVLTFDAGGTNFVFSAIRGGQQILENQYHAFQKCRRRSEYQGCSQELPFSSSIHRIIVHNSQGDL